MHIISKDEYIQDVAKEWREAYCTGEQWLNERLGGKHERLLTLGEDATEQQVVNIIGNTSWTANRCSECGRDVDVTVHFGEEPDYDTVWADVCPECLQKAVELVEEERGKHGRGREELEVNDRSPSD